MNIRADVFPALVSVTPAGEAIALTDVRSAPPSPGSFQVTIARVVITGNRIIIAQDKGDGPQVVFADEIDPTTYYKNPSRTEDSYIQTVSGKKIAFKRDSACGCGSRLRSWNPYQGGVMSNRDPQS